MLKKILAVFLAFAAVCVLLCSCGKEMRESKTNIAVIVKAVDSDFWHNVQDGVNSAATELNVSVTFEGAVNEEDYYSQNKLIQKAIDNKADAIVLSAISYDKSSELVNEAVRNGIKVVTVDSSVDSDLVDLFIGTDNYKAGQSAAQTALEGFSDEVKINIGIVNVYESTQNGRDREKGFRDYISQYANAEISGVVNVSSNTMSATAGALSLMYQHPEINVLVGFNEWTTLGVGNAISQLGLSGKVKGIGFDTNVLCVEMVENGTINALIAQNPFSIGYLGVKAASELVTGTASSFGTQKQIYTDVTTVTRENLFDDDVQKMVFRFR